MTVPVGDVEALRAALVRILEHPEVVGEYRGRARERASDLPTWDTVTDKTEELYYRLVSDEV